MGGMQAYRRRAAETERMIDAAVEEVAAARREAWRKAADAVKKADAERHRFTRDELVDAVLVRDIYGWASVVRVNTATVTVNADFGTRKIPFGRVLEVRP